MTSFDMFIHGEICEVSPRLGGFWLYSIQPSGWLQPSLVAFDIIFTEKIKVEHLLGLLMTSSPILAHFTLTGTCSGELKSIFFVQAFLFAW